MAGRLERVSDALDFGLHPEIGGDAGGEEGGRQGAAQKCGKDQTAFVQVHGLATHSL